MSVELKADARTIQSFLPTGEPRGIRIWEITTPIVQAVAVPRSDLVKARSRPELDHVALYFLFGESEQAAKPLVYVGQTSLKTEQAMGWPRFIPESAWCGDR